MDRCMDIIYIKHASMLSTYATCLHILNFSQRYVRNEMVFICVENVLFCWLSALAYSQEN